MPESSSLEELIRNKEIEFFSYGRRLDTDLENYGEYNRDLLKHLVQKSDNFITIRGSALQSYLINEDNLYNFASFVGCLWYCYDSVASVSKKPQLAIHVEVDVNILGQYYQKPTEEEMINGAGQIFDVTDWAPEILYFDKIWSFVLYGALFETGHEHPRDDASFRYQMTGQAEIFMIGTKEQLTRYKTYALNSLLGVEAMARHITAIKENIAHFSVDYESN